jgi:hypothetical protein
MGIPFDESMFGSATGGMAFSEDDIGELGDEFDELIEIAQGLKAAVDSDTRRMEMFVMLTISAVLASGLILFGLPAIMSSTEVVISAFILCLAYGVAPAWLAWRLRRRCNRNKRALNRIVAIIGEVVSVANKHGQWSPVKRARYEIALSALEY